MGGHDNHIVLVSYNERTTRRGATVEYVVGSGVTKRLVVLKTEGWVDGIMLRGQGWEKNNCGEQ